MPSVTSAFYREGTGSVPFLEALKTLSAFFKEKMRMKLNDERFDRNFETLVMTFQAHSLVWTLSSVTTFMKIALF